MLGLLPLFAVAAALIVLMGTAAMIRAATHPKSNGYATYLARGLPVEPGDVNATGTETTLHLTRGDTTTAFDLDGRDPDGPCVVFVHGHSATRYAALRLFGPLLDHVSRVVAFDLPGHGDCSARACTMGVREPHDIAAALEQIDDGTTPLVLFGSSMGAQCSIAAAAGPSAGRLAGLVLLGVYRHYSEAIPGHLRRHALPRYPFLPLGQAWLQLRHGRASRFNRAQEARQLRMPVLLLHGELDDLCPLTAAEAICDAVNDGGGEAELVVFPGGKHTCLHESHPDIYRDAMVRFLERFRHASTPLATSPAASIQGV